MAVELLNLPNELIGHIVGFLGDTPPSLLYNKEHPTRPRASSNSSLPLKQASILSRRLRRATLPHLFRHIAVLPDHLDSVLAFTSTQGLAVHVATAQIYLHGPCTHRRPQWWTSLLDHFPNLTTLEIVAPPNVFAEITKCPIKLQDAWAFKIAHQTIRLSCTPTAITNISRPMPTSSSSLLTARPWTTLHVNESSSLPAYTTYEYFLRTPPCPLPPATFFSAQTNPSHHPLQTLLQHLRSFHFTAIFPTYNHVAEITALIEAQMPDLENLTFQLLPKPSSTILQDTLEATGNHIDVNDPWNEFETSLLLVARAAVRLSSARGSVVGAGGDLDGPADAIWGAGEGDEGGHGRILANPSGKLRTLKIEDVAMEGVRSTIEEVITRELSDRPELGWSYEGQGIWRRQGQTGNC